MAELWNIVLIINLSIVALTLSVVETTNSIEDTLSFVNNLLNKLNSTTNPKLILVIGNAGSGKSTLIHYVAGDLSKMSSKETSNPSLSTFEIRDEMDKNRSTHATETRTLIPQMYTDDQQIVWCDTPGFGDTPNKTVEIATMLLIKRVIESASNMKIVLVVNSDSVSQSSNRDDFDNLLSRSTELMKNVDHFQNSVSLVISKAISFKVLGRQIIDMFEENVKNSTVQFINEHRSFLIAKGLNEQKIKLIDALLMKQSADYPKLSVFWRPNDVGRFDRLDKMVNGRRFIRESIVNHSAYAAVNLQDFGFPLTPEAQVNVRDMVDYTIQTISTVPQQIIDTLLMKVQNQIESTNTLKGRLEVLNIGMGFIQMNADNTERSVTLDRLIEQTQKLIVAYNVTLPIDNNELKRIQRNEKSLSILNSLITTKQNESVDYNSFYEKIVGFFVDRNATIRNGIRKKTQETIKTISTILEHVDNQLTIALNRKLETIDGFLWKLEQLEFAQNQIQPTIAANELTLKQRIHQMKNLTQSYELNKYVSINELNRIFGLEQFVITMKSADDLQLSIRDLIATSSNAISYQQSMHDWYSFLSESYRHFGAYDIQNDSIEMPPINEHNFKAMAKKVRQNANFVPTESKIKELNEVINMTHNREYRCENEMLTIKGTFVKSSDIEKALIRLCPSVDAITKIKVFVLDTFYVNSNLYLNKSNEVELQIMARTWDIRIDATFYLNGIHGELQPVQPMGNEGHPGKCGKPGTNAGNFVGYAHEIVNGNRLSIELNGGNGGNGQDGTGTSDVYVAFDEVDNSDWTNSNERADYYYWDFFRKKGFPHSELIYSFSYYQRPMKYNIYQTFELYPDRCCSASMTGAGGYGKSLDVIW